MRLIPCSILDRSPEVVGSRTRRMGFSLSFWSLWSIVTGLVFSRPSSKLFSLPFCCSVCCRSPRPQPAVCVCWFTDGILAGFAGIKCVYYYCQAADSVEFAFWLSFLVERLLCFDPFVLSSPLHHPTGKDKVACCVVSVSHSHNL